jgi:hypothetical protein
MVFLSSALAPGSPASEFPDPVHSFDYYTQNGTSIPIGGLGTSGTNRIIQYKVLSAGVNTLGGGVNANGIYVIDCQGQNLVISNFRMFGTLVILNPGSGTTIQGAVYFAPNTLGAPSLMVQGDCAIATGSTNLADNVAQTANFNIAGAPYLGATDTTYSTSYPCRFDGIVYVSGNLTTSNTFTTQGTVIVNGTWTSSGTANLVYDPASYNNPPPGFTSSKPAPVSGSWRWENAQ